MFTWSNRSVWILGTRSPVSSSGTTVCSVVGVGAPGSTHPSTPRRRSLRRQPRAQGAAGQGGSGARRLGLRRRRGSRLGPVRPGELPNIHHCKEYEETLDKPPEYRITHLRGQEIPAEGRDGDHGPWCDRLIAEAEAESRYPHDTTDGKNISVLYNVQHLSPYEGLASTTSAPKARGTVGCVERPKGFGRGRGSESEHALLVPRLRQCGVRECPPGAVVTARLSAYRRATKMHSRLSSSSGS